MVEWQLCYFCFHGKYTKWTFFLRILLHTTPLTAWQLACHNSKVAHIAEEGKNPTYHKMKISIYSLLWARVHDKAPDEINRQFISEVTLISFVPIVKTVLLQKMQQNLSPHIWIPSRNSPLLYKAAKSFESMHTSNDTESKEIWCHENLLESNLPYPPPQRCVVFKKSLLSLKSYCIALMKLQQKFLCFD